MIKVLLPLLVGLLERRLTDAFSPSRPAAVTCTGPVARMTHGEHFWHENDTSFQVTFRTHINLHMDLNHASCFQVDLEGQEIPRDGGGNGNGTSGTFSGERGSPNGDIDSMFYVVKYVEFSQQHQVRSNFQFGIPEFQSSCKCDCPKSDTFCDYSYDMKYCSKGEICVQKFLDNQRSYGCQHRGPANLCCDISVRPFEGRVFTGAVLAVPMSIVKVKIDIYVHYRDKWSLAREYIRDIMPGKSANHLYLNGDENIANFYVGLEAKKPVFELETWDKVYFFENTAEKFALKESPVGTNVKSYTKEDYEFLMYRDGRWRMDDALVKIHQAHLPTVTNCRGQTYIDRYDDSDLPFFVIRNNSGALSSPFRPGSPLTSSYQVFVQDIKRHPSNNMLPLKYIQLYHSTNSAPSIDLDIRMEQKIKVVAHQEQSRMQNFIADIRLDRNLNRYLNITLIQAYGQFGIELYRDRSYLDVTLSTTTLLPLAANFTDIIALPSHIEGSKYICVFAERAPAKRKCRWAAYKKEKVTWFQLAHTFIESQGSCPGCNQETKEGGSFLSFLNPKKWFNGIGSVSEGVALALEIAFYVVIFVLATAVCRKIVWPFTRWALCSSSPKMMKSSFKKEPIEV